MKKLILAFLAITFLLSCSSDGSNISSYSILERADKTASFDENFHRTDYYSNGDKLMKFRNNNNVETIYTYDSDDKITQATTTFNGDIAYRITFNYDGFDRVISVHDFAPNHSPQNQDRIITWIDNKMIIPVLWDIENRFELTFNDDNLVINHKYITESGEIGFNYNYEYDENENMIRKFGKQWGYSFNVAYYYDNKNNPFYPYFKKYQMVNRILFQGISLDRSMYVYAKNNTLKYKNLLNGEFGDDYSIYEYRGNTTIQSKIKKTGDDAFEIVTDFTYDDDDY